MSTCRMNKVLISMRSYDSQESLNSFPIMWFRDSRFFAWKYNSFSPVQVPWNRSSHFSRVVWNKLYQSCHEQSVLKYQNRDYWHKKQWILRTILSSDDFVVSVKYCCIIGIQKSKWFNWMPLLLKEATRCGIVLNSTGFLMSVESTVGLCGGF